MTDPNDLKRVASFFPNPAPEAFPNAAAYIAAMLPFQAVYVNEKTSLERVINTSRIGGFKHFG